MEGGNNFALIIKIKQKRTAGSLKISNLDILEYWRHILFIVPSLDYVIEPRTQKNGTTGGFTEKVFSP